MFANQTYTIIIQKNCKIPMNTSGYKGGGKGANCPPPPDSALKRSRVVGHIQCVSIYQIIMIILIMIYTFLFVILFTYKSNFNAVRALRPTPTLAKLTVYP